MARTVTQIYNEILTEKSKYSSLAGLTNTSATAIWRTFFYAIAVVIATSEQLRDVFQTNLLAIAETLPTGTNKWYAQELLKYQEGYTTSFNRTTGKVEYAVEDENARILIAATAETEGPNLVLKCIKSDGNGGGKELSAMEYESVYRYIQDFKFAGPVVLLVSDPGDILRLEMNVEVDATIINSIGQSMTNSSVYPVEDVIQEFLISYQNSNFDSTFVLIKLIDAIQEVSGVKNVVVTTAQAKKHSGQVFTDILANNLQKYNTWSGWLKIDSTYTLRDNITYIV